MTVPATARELGNRLPNMQERDAANQLRQILASHVDSESQLLNLVTEDGGTAQVTLMPALSRLLIEVLRHVGSGNAVTLVPVGQMLSTQQAADILNVSRPHLISILESGRIPHVLVGRHRRIKANDLFEYKRMRDAERGKALEILAEIDSELL